MKPIKNFGRFIVENTLFDPGTFEAMLKDAISKKQETPLYVEKQLSLGTISHMKMIAKKLGLHVIVMSAESINDKGKSFARFLQEEPMEKTLVIFDDMERAKEATISFIEDSIGNRKVFDTPISDLYYFAEVHLIDKAIMNYGNDQTRVTYNTPETTNVIKPRTGNGGGVIK